ncbi:MAG: SDR family oxidoreductase [Planctomycetia bacterium]|jgi:NAD(P)-dependent dehydrogenase (short-subunit alcohol dehydrogenase family)
MKMAEKIFRKFGNMIKRMLFIVESLGKVCRYGGYSTVNIACVNHGEVLKGKRVLITGGGSGIGLSIAKKCLQEGAIVVVTGRNKTKLESVAEEVNNPLLKVLVWDISHIPEIEENIVKAEELLEGDIDVLVNNAGIPSRVHFPNVTEESWDRIYATNSKGLFFLTQSLCGKWMKKQNVQPKKVINISSQGGFVGATYPYRMTKWDVAGLTQGLGIELAPFGILVNGIAPGIVATDMLPGCLKQKENVYYPENPIKRFALPEEIAELAIFLISDTSNFIVGQTIVCDGGYSLK